MTETTERSYVDDVGGLFADYDKYSDARECIAADLRNFGAEEVAQQFARTEQFLWGLLYTAEGTLGWGAMMVLGEAHTLAKEARKRAEKYAERSRE